MASMFFGGLFAGWLLDTVGRRLSLAIACVISIGGVTAQYVASRPVIFLTGKMITGFTQGLFLTIAPAYISEISPTVLRGAFIASVNFSIVLGQLLAQLVLKGASFQPGNRVYKILFAVQWGFSGLTLLGVPFMPESPWWLIRRGEHERARVALRRLCRQGLVELRFREISDTIAESLLEGKAKYTDCFRGTDLRRTLIAMAVFIVQPLSGGPFVTGYQTYYLQLAGLPVDQTYTLTGANFAVMLVGNCIGMYLCERVGRRPIMLWGSYGLTILLIFIGVLGSIPVHATVYPQVVFMSLWGLAYQVTIGAVGWAVSAEVSTPRLRGATQALCTMTNAVIGVILAFTLPYMITPNKGDMGAKICFVFLAFMIPIDIWAFYNFPELRGRSYMELDFLFHARVKTRKFGGHKIPSLSSGSC
ncbi:hypothetical protein FGG08_001473 [Glutinoglossum americanum]|uniref:Major facilitator superfamily (MFS) profile domain-containing protein n=1 Tax=Glutinoglossum americanum TaxID=1670608 RepID=A0A9P8IDK3_9PEZI|nr:hypothetical protein FGG08_001473 [Glutinoglossum americanum]